MCSETDHAVVEPEQVLREIAAVLAGNSRDQRAFPGCRGPRVRRIRVP
jgi:hypothetical protein